MRISKKKIILFVIMLLLFVGFVWGIIYLKSVADYKQAVKETTFEEINISDISDGVYILEHRHDRGKAAEAISNKIVDEQKIDVDAISGATNSSTVIKKAVENALKNGL